ncbi:hypothetical protein C817_05318 [Dorea sp. 5-2]|nr:hypothetical protein C817_05318 [Dorea sp. 5-2]
MFEIYSAILSTLVSADLGISLKDLKKILYKEKYKNTESLEISKSIDTVSRKLEDSKEIIENALLEMEEQKKLFEQMKKEAEISQQISSMNEEQVSALNELLEKTLNRQDKKAFPKNFLWNLFFCVLSAVLGFLLGKYL